MKEVWPPPWTPTSRALWQRIEGHDLEPADALNFTRRLARDHGWSLGFARSAILEYRRFCFLAVTSPDQVTPSEEVDEVWHLHLTYSRNYWEVWCRTVLAVPLHHDPTSGGPAEQSRFRAQYAATLAYYEACFGSPDPVFWPATHRRFRARPRFRVVDTDDRLPLLRPAALWRLVMDAVRVRCRSTRWTGPPDRS